MKLLHNQVRQAEFCRQVFVAVPEAGADFKDLIKPEAWAHVHQQFQRGTRIEVMPEDGAYFAELYVTSVSLNAAHVVVLRKIDLDKVKENSVAKQSAFEYAYKGPVKLHCVIRKSDKEIVKDSLPSKKACLDWIEQNEKVTSQKD
jgi:hypothetical protein